MNWPLCRTPDGQPRPRLETPQPDFTKTLVNFSTKQAVLTIVRVPPPHMTKSMNVVH